MRIGPHVSLPAFTFASPADLPSGFPVALRAGIH
jgi:hypothetical protein